MKAKFIVPGGSGSTFPGVHTPRSNGHVIGRKSCLGKSTLYNPEKMAKLHLLQRTFYHYNPCLPAMLLLLIFTGTFWIYTSIFKGFT